MLSAFFGVMAALGAIYYALSTLALASHFRRRPPDPMVSMPRISVLKPVRGLDPELRYNLLTYLSQDYPDYEVMFGTLDADDPAMSLLEDLSKNWERASVHTGTTLAGSNDKVRILHELAGRASGEILVITDADTRVTPDFLWRMAAYFSDEGVGAATCFYRGVKARRFADALEGLHMTCLFAPGVAAAEALGGIKFGLGAAIAIRRSVLQQIGGFGAIVDYLADDFQLGRRTAQAGHRVALTDYVVEIGLGGDDLAGVLARELRWCRTIRVSSPYGYFGMITTFGFAYALFFLAATGFSLLGWTGFAGVSVLRLCTAWLGAVCLGDREFASRAHLLPLRDVMSLVIWITGYFSRQVTWKGRRLQLASDGTVKPAPHS